MKHTMKCAVVLMFSMNVLESPAQFYTAEKVGPAADTLSISTDPYVRDVLHETKPKPKVETETKKKSVFRLPLRFVSDRKVRKQTANFQQRPRKSARKRRKSLEESSKSLRNSLFYPFSVPLTACF